jgi:hypothetical protein
VQTAKRLVHGSIIHRWRKAERRLVQHQQLCHHQGAADRQHLPLAAGHGALRAAHAAPSISEDLVDALQKGGCIRALPPRSGVAPSSRLFSTLCCTNSRQPSGDSARPLRTIAVRLPADLFAVEADRSGMHGNEVAIALSNPVCRRRWSRARQRDHARGHIERNIGDAIRSP